MRIVVFGGGGYIGIPLCEALSWRGHTVTIYDRFYFGKKPKESRCTSLQGDIRTIDTNPANWTGADAMIDLAGLSNDATAEIDPALTRAINLEGGKRIATLAKEVRARYVYSSSCAVYGHSVGTNITEQHVLRPQTDYAICKAQVEDHINSLAGDGFRPVILRNGTVFGVAPRMRFDLAVNVMTMRAWKEGLIYVMGGGEQIRPFVHVRDVVDAFVLAVEGVGAGTYNIVGENLSIAELARKVGMVFPEAFLHRIPDNPDRRSYHVSAFKAQVELEWKNNSKLLGNTAISVDAGIHEVKKALQTGEIHADDPTTHTLKWYKSLIEWDKRLSEIKIGDSLL